MSGRDPWERVRLLFEAALDQPLEGRAAFVSAASDGDEGLRREVMSLLSAHAAAGGFLETPFLPLEHPRVAMPAPTLQSGRRIGNFQVVAPLGAGGMGEVYRAHDVHLGRDVALKVLPPAFAEDRDRLARFERESRILASLNHPNIASIHSIEHADGLHILVLELVEGPTLADRLSRGRMSVPDAIALARQLACALEAAHERGIVHRDLKPGNIKMPPSGSIKLLDFGLAKEHVPPDSTAPDAEPRTIDGAILGTCAYMSPEQARGQPVDRRADIWAFGCILFESLADRRAFPGNTPSDTIAAVLERQPDWNLLPASTPLRIRLLLRRCLEKDPYRRLHDIGDVRIEIDEAIQPSRDPSAGGRTGGTGVSRQHRMSATFWVLLAVLVAGTAVGRFLPTRASAVPSFRPVTFRRGEVPAARFGPDGQSIVYAFSAGGPSPDLYSAGTDGSRFRSLGFADSQLLSVSKSRDLAVALDWRWTGPYTGAGTLARVPLDGGAARPLADNVALADWYADGTQLAIVRIAAGIARLEFPIGMPVFSADTTGGTGIFDLRVSPRGDSVALVTADFNGVHSVLTVNRAARTRVLSTGWRRVQGLAWTSDGAEVWFAGADSSSSEVDGVYAVTVDGKQRLVARFPGSLAIDDIASDGRVLLTQSQARREVVGRLAGDRTDRDLTWLDYSFPAGLSPDGRNLLFYETGAAAGPRPALWLRTAGAALPVRLGEGDVGSSLSPDGKWVAVKQVTKGGRNGLKLLPTGTGQERMLDLHGVSPLLTAWLPDGAHLIIAGGESARKVRIYVLDVRGGAPRPVAPEGVTPSLIGPDSRSILAVQDGLPVLYPIEPGEPHKFASTANQAALHEAFATLHPLQWAGNDHTIFASQRGVPARILRLDLETGRTSAWKDVLPSDITGVRDVEPMLMTRDGAAYVSSFRRVLSRLYVAEGLK